MPMRLDGSCRCNAISFSVDSHTPYPYQRCYCSICGFRRCRPVATENRIRAGADAAMGYPRFAMLDLLKLLSGLLVGLFRSHAAREAETAFLRQQLVVLKRSAPARLRLRPADRLVPFRAPSRGCLQA